jgi:hypothetical protein
MTPERTRTDEQPTTVVERRRTGFVVLAIVMAALLGFGLGWAMFRDTGTDIPADVQELMDAYAEAWNEPNGEAAVALMTPGARFYASIYVPDEGYGGDDLADYINGLGSDAITTESMTVIGDGPYLVVGEDRAGGYDGTSAIHVVNSGDELLISGHHWYRN